MNETELAMLCEKWQKTLRLQDWDIELALVRQSELHDENGNVDARCFPILTRKEAKIKVLDPIDFQGERLKDAGSPDDIETLIIHEILHLHFESFWDDDKEVEMEQAIHSLAKAFKSIANAAPLPVIDGISAKLTNCVIS